MSLLNTLKESARRTYYTGLAQCRQVLQRAKRTASPRVLVALGTVLVVLVGVQVWASISLSYKALAVSESLANRDIAKTFADKLRSLARSTGSGVYEHVREVAAFNPSVRMHLVDEHGIVKASPDGYGRMQLPFVDTRPIRRALQRGDRNEVVYGDDPHQLKKLDPISVAPIKVDGQQNYVYVVLADTGLTEAFSRAAGFTVGLGTLLLTGTLVVIVLCLAFAVMYRRLHGINTSIAAISHDLRGPLSSVQGYLETLLERGDRLDKKDSHKYMSVALKSTQSVATLVNDLHHLSKLEVTGAEIDKESFSLRDLVMDVAMSSMPACDDKHNKLVSDVPPCLPLVHGNIQLIERLVRNLVDNAIKYTSHGGRIDLSLAITAGKVRVTVADTGCGIPETELAKIGSQFYRGEKTRSSTSGSGIGLSISKRIAETHGSELRILSREDEGTVVLFELPQATPAGRVKQRQAY
jgi:signal transduction histidine kinase